MFLFGKLKAGNASYQSPKSVLESHISEYFIYKNSISLNKQHDLVKEYKSFQPDLGSFP